MPFISIPAVYANDPTGSAFVPKASFVSTDPFAIVMQVQVSSDVVQAGLRFNAVLELVNPREDPYRGSWFTFVSGDVLDMPTKNDHWFNTAFSGTFFAARSSWPSYAVAVTEIFGGEKLRGVFRTRASIDVIGSNLFADREGMPYKVVP
jgi:hypothetical protein